MAKQSILQQVRSIARKAAKSGSKWHEKKGGAIACKDGRCTMAAVMFGELAPARKLQEEFEAIIAKASKLDKQGLTTNFSTNDTLFDDGLYVEDFPDTGVICNALGLEGELVDTVVNANDNSRKSLLADVEDARDNHFKEDGPLSEDAEYQIAKRNLAARIILERELLGRK